MVISEIRDFIEKLGYEVLISGTHREHAHEWREWYRGKVDTFHKYTVFNGINDVPCIKRTLGMAKKSCEDWADLLLNEKVKIAVENQEILDAILKDNNFRDEANALLEKTFALGTGAFVEYRTSELSKNVRIDYIMEDMIFPLRVENGKIVDVAFASQLADKQYYINIHLKEGNKYKVENIIFDVEKYGKYNVSELPTGVKRFIYSDVPLFQIIKPNIVNNSDMNSPMGLSIFANAVDEMMDVDEKYDSYFNEFRLGKQRLFVDPTAMNVIPDGSSTPKPAFNTNDLTFYAYPNDKENGKPIEQTSFSLRVPEHDQALQTAINLFGDKVGFGNDFYSFTKGSVYTNTAQVINTNSKLYRRLKKHELILERALQELARAVISISTGQVYDGEVNVDFDDSIIEDKVSERQQYKDEVAMGAMSLVEYRMKVYKEDEKTAKSKIPEQSDVMS